MDEALLLLALLGLPLLPYDQAWILFAVAGFVLGCALVTVGCWAWADHRWPPAERRHRGEDATTVELPRMYQGRHRQPRAHRLTLRPGSAVDLNRQATTEAKRQLAERDPGDGEDELRRVTWRIGEEARRG